MKKIKSLLCLLLAFVMVTALLTGCGRKKDKDSDQSAAATEEIDLEELTAVAKSNMPNLTDAADFARRYGGGLTAGQINEFMAFMQVCRDNMNDEAFCAAMKDYLTDTKDIRKAIADMFSDGLKAAGTMGAEETADIARANISAASLNVDVPAWTVEYLNYQKDPASGDIHELTEKLTGILNQYADLFYGKELF